MPVLGFLIFLSILIIAFHSSSFGLCGSPCSVVSTFDISAYAFPIAMAVIISLILAMLALILQAVLGPQRFIARSTQLQGMGYQDYLKFLNNRLEKDKFRVFDDHAGLQKEIKSSRHRESLSRTISETLSKYKVDFFAFRRNFFFPNIVCAVSYSENPSMDYVKQYSQAIYHFGLGYIAAVGAGQNTKIVYPVLVSQRFPSEITQYVEGKAPSRQTRVVPAGRYFAPAFDFGCPVLVELESGTIFNQSKNRRTFRKAIVKYFTPQDGLTSTQWPSHP